MKAKIVIPAILAIFALSACAEGTGNKQTFGTIGGAVAGGLLGSQVGSGSGRLVTTGLGTLLGAWAGSEIGASLDRADQTYAQQAAQRSLESAPTGAATTWTNPDSGHYGSITPTSTTPRGNTYCRDYTQTIYVEGRSETATGTACRNPDGTWAVANQ